ncbi:hypothetical protein Tco_0493730 [Tanacetum coccineum]
MHNNFHTWSCFNYSFVPMIMFRSECLQAANSIGTETDTVHPQVHDGGSGVVAMDEGQGAAKGISIKEYLVKTFKPEDEDKALLDQNHHTSSLSPLATHQVTL